MAIAYGIALTPWWSCALPRSLPQRGFVLSTAVLTTICYLCGLVSVAGLALFPHRSDLFYLGLQFAVALLIFWAARRLPGAARVGPTWFVQHGPWRRLDILLAALVFTVALVLVAMAVLLPLSSNDPLEYALVGREMYSLRALADYPLLNTDTPSGMYAPWTHPPLYIGLIFLANVISGGAELPGLMRLVAPMLTVMSTALIYWLGCAGGRRVGLLSALIFITTPFIFAQAMYGAIDALVISALLLGMAAVFACQPETLRGRLTIGVVMGLGLWSHSQAILFPFLLGGSFLVVCGGLNKRMLTTALVVVLVGGAIGCWPYLRNVLIFGSPISDNNLVFALSSLDWQGYFRLSRGYALMADRLQYGLFKGWFTLHLYGLTWWWMLLGLIFLPRRGSPSPAWRQITHLCVAIIAIYLAGMGLSLFAGTDLMIRNDRYMLVLMPYVSLLAGWGVFRLAGNRQVTAEAA
ncbi:ArnT family glycosyltransferase [Bordetella avium]|nr:hypothetical protein [Bordetella avium]WQE33511.1 hypothetical protein U0029_16745 [Bordetella avium]